jgi:nitroimidazol reductase NimA-like FMN-containing flavoprotein (pyridoxamine 5'-phosphate oxidase superfamily)
MPARWVKVPEKWILEAFLSYNKFKNFQGQKEEKLKNPSRLKKLLKDLFSSQPLAVLATQGDGQPYGNLVAFAATEDLKGLLFATARGTRKFANMTMEPRVAMVMDSRTNQKADFQRAIAVTATGTVKEVEIEERDHLLNLYLSKHPHLKKFVNSPNTALLRVKVDTYYIVRKFQEVMVLSMRQ